MQSLSDQYILNRLAAMAEEYDPVVKVVEKCKDVQEPAYQLVLAKGYYTVKILIPIKMVEAWLGQNERTAEAAIRRIISAATDYLDARDLHLQENLGFWDWTGDRR